MDEDLLHTSRFQERENCINVKTILSIRISNLEAAKFGQGALLIHLPFLLEPCSTIKDMVDEFRICVKVVRIRILLDLESLKIWQKSKGECEVGIPISFP